MNTPEIFQFHIDAFRPETIPMSRLAEYMAALAALYGNNELVHFDKMRTGSAVLQVKVDEIASPKIGHRLKLVHSSNAPQDVTKAFISINNLLRADNAVGKIKREKGAVLLKFPGRETPAPKIYRVKETGALDGTVIRIGGRDNTIPVWLQDRSGVIAYCEANKHMALELVSHYLGAPIRVTGQGDWIRDEDGQWKLERFKITDWNVLEDTPVEEILNAARNATGNHWNELENPIEELNKIRGSE